MTDTTKQLIERFADALEAAQVEIERLREAAKGSLVIVNAAQAGREAAEARVKELETALAEVRQELWVGYCLDSGRTDLDPWQFNSMPHIRTIDSVLSTETKEKV